MPTIVLKKAALRHEESLCRACCWAHIQKGFRESEEAVFCCFSKFRPVPFKVADCTDFSNENVPTREQMENMALIIPTKPARKKAGFRGAGFASEGEAGGVDEVLQEEEALIEEQEFAGGENDGCIVIRGSRVRTPPRGQRFPLAAV